MSEGAPAPAPAQAPGSAGRRSLSHRDAEELRRGGGAPKKLKGGTMSTPVPIEHIVPINWQKSTTAGMTGFFKLGYSQDTLACNWREPDKQIGYYSEEMIKEQTVTKEKPDGDTKPPEAQLWYSGIFKNNTVWIGPDWTWTSRGWANPVGPARSSSRAEKLAAMRANNRLSMAIAIGRIAIDFGKGLEIAEPDSAMLSLINNTIHCVFQTISLTPAQAKMWLFHERPLTGMVLRALQPRLATRMLESKDMFKFLLLAAPPTAPATDLVVASYYKDKLDGDHLDDFTALADVIVNGVVEYSPPSAPRERPDLSSLFGELQEKVEKILDPKIKKFEVRSVVSVNYQLIGPAATVSEVQLSPLGAALYSITLSDVQEFIVYLNTLCDDRTREAGKKKAPAVRHTKKMFTDAKQKVAAMLETPTLSALKQMCDAAGLLAPRGAMWTTVTAKKALLDDAFPEVAAPAAVVAVAVPAPAVGVGAGPSGAAASSSSGAA